MFNWVGCWFFISWFENHEAAHFVSRVDHDQYDPDQLIVLKVSAEGIPYSNSSTIFERADGEIEVGNIHYRYVRKRLYNDSVEFLCLPDQETSRLRGIKNELLRLTTDLPGGHGKSNSKGKTAQLLLKTFWQDVATLSIGGCSALPISADIARTTSLSQGFVRVGKQPPRRNPDRSNPSSSSI